jgi:hypothetical protein
MNICCRYRGEWGRDVGRMAWCLSEIRARVDRCRVFDRQMSSQRTILFRPIVTD